VWLGGHDATKLRVVFELVDMYYYVFFFLFELDFPLSFLLSVSLVPSTGGGFVFLGILHSIV